MTREGDTAQQDLLVDSKGVLIVERGEAGEHLEHQDAESPPINFGTVALALDDLRGQVLWCST